MIHIWWECPKLHGFWNKVFHLIRRVTGCAIPQMPAIALLNGLASCIPKITRKLILFILTGAKITIEESMEATHSLFIIHEKKGFCVMTQEKLVSSILDTTAQFEAIWKPWAQLMAIQVTDHWNLHLVERRLFFSFSFLPIYFSFLLPISFSLIFPPFLWF